MRIKLIHKPVLKRHECYEVITGLAATVVVCLAWAPF